MRQDQFEKLQQLEEKLIDTFLGEAAPEKWPGSGLETAAMDQQTRGDRYWCKKNAVATMSLVGRIGNFLQRIVTQGGEQLPPPAGEEKPADDENGLDKELATFEKEASRILDRVQAGSKQVNGKP